MSDDRADGRTASTGERYRRRDVLGALGAAGALALAGCSSDGGGDSGGSDGGGGGSDGGGSNDGDGGATPTQPTGGTDRPQSTPGGQKEVTGQTPDYMDDGGGGGGQTVSCSSPSVTYTTKTFSPMGMSGKISAAAPERARFVSDSFNMAIHYGGGQADAITVTGSKFPAGSVQSAGDAMSQSETEVTDQYDFAVSEARAFRQIQREGRRVVVVLLPAEKGYYRLQVTIGNRACPATTNAIAATVIESLQPA